MQESLTRRTEYFKKLVKSDGELEDIGEGDQEKLPTKQGIEGIIKMLRNNKAPREKGITAKMLIKDERRTRIRKYCNKSSMERGDNAMQIAKMINMFYTQK
ncbi:hypothetical protein QE152_g9225 [Popillia japonica]|uniref:Uncharacterized protein n=1 Tax=Popillia japonica TaxID=7064 RepID=A0AAW1LZ16_POPJA